jgi:ankyrin repeat protein
VEIHRHADAGDCDGVLQELANGADVDERDDDDLTPLAHAANDCGIALALPVVASPVVAPFQGRWVFIDR